MRAIVITLAILSAALAASTVYLARELSLERERHAAPTAAPAVSASSSPAPRSAESPRPAGPKGPSAAATPAGPESSSGFSARALPMSEEEMKKSQSDYAKRFLEQLADPQGREELLAERKMMMRNSYPRVAQYLGLTPEEYARFLELSALQQIDVQEAHSRCAVDPNCSMQDVFRNRPEFRDAELRELLGQDRMEKFATYKNTMGEREAVTQLRTRLPDALRLSDAKAESLVTALAEEREALHREAAQRGNGVTGFGIGAGMIFSPDDSRPLDERYEEARRYSQRLHDRAAQVLNSEQLRAFDEMQDETLLGLRSMMRGKNGATFSTVTIAQ